MDSSTLSSSSSFPTLCCPSLSPSLLQVLALGVRFPAHCRPSLSPSLLQVLALGARFPVVNGLLNAIRRKKSKDTIVLACVIAGCVLFTLVYIMFK